MRKSETETTKPKFNRRAEVVGANILKLSENEPVFVKVMSRGTFVSKNYPDGIDYLEVTNLESGEVQWLWLDGGLKGSLSMLLGSGKINGMSLEITKTGQESIDLQDGTPGRVNTYRLFEIEETPVTQ
jgi:hypothetical protein